MSERKCPCGSGHTKQANFDGHGIFLFYSCPECYGEKRSHYRSDIFERYDCDEPIESE
jgi:hypothetical protein